MLSGGRGSSDSDTEKRKSYDQKKPEAEDAQIEDEEEKKRKEEERRRREEEEKKKKREEERRKEEAKQKREEERRKKKELVERKKQEEERRRAEEMEDDESEIQELEAQVLEGGLPDHKDLYKYFPYTDFPEVFTSYDKLQTLAREYATTSPSLNAPDKC